MKQNNLLSNLVWALILIGIIFLVISSVNYDKSFSNDNSNNNTSDSNFQKKQNTVNSGSSLFALENNYNFNKISMIDGNVKHRFEVKNEGTDSITIEKVFTSCMCTTAVIISSSGKKYGTFGMPGHKLPAKTNIEIGGGESIIVEATFNPNAHGPSAVGLAQRSIYLETNSANSPKLELRFQAMVVK